MASHQVTSVNLEARDVSSDRTSLAQRIEAFRDITPTANPKLLVKAGNATAMAKSEACIPETTSAELSVDILRTALAEHGALIVRGMFSREDANALTQVIDRVIAASETPRETRSKLPSPYFFPLDNLTSILPKKNEDLACLRMLNRAVGGVMAVEAPSVAEALLQFYDRHGIKDLLSAYFDEPPCLSVKKWVLRRSKLPVSSSEWHQDGAFMGTDINSVNLWIPLTECGGETGAPGMDVVPRRLYEVGTAEGSVSNWTVCDELIKGGAFDAQAVAPVFHQGDAFFFDHLYLHRTQSREDFTRVRYAIETWFFGATTFPKDQVPIRW